MSTAPSDFGRLYLQKKKPYEEFLMLLLDLSEGHPNKKVQEIAKETVLDRHGSQYLIRLSGMDKKIAHRLKKLDSDKYKINLYHHFNDKEADAFLSRAAAFQILDNYAVSERRKDKLVSKILFHFYDYRGIGDFIPAVQLLLDKNVLNGQHKYRFLFEVINKMRFIEWEGESGKALIKIFKKLEHSMGVDNFDRLLVDLVDQTHKSAFGHSPEAINGIMRYYVEVERSPMKTLAIILNHKGAAYLKKKWSKSYVDINSPAWKLRELLLNAMKVRGTKTEAEAIRLFKKYKLLSQALHSFPRKNIGIYNPERDFYGDPRIGEAFAQAEYEEKNGDRKKQKKENGKRLGNNRGTPDITHQEVMNQGGEEGARPTSLIEKVTKCVGENIY